MPPVPSKDGDPAARTAAATRLIVGTLRTLAWGHHEVVYDRLLTTIDEHHRTGDPAVIEHFAESLLMTARMERSPSFLAAVQRPDKPGELRDIRDVIAEIEAQQNESPA